MLVALSKRVYIYSRRVQPLKAYAPIDEIFKLSSISIVFKLLLPLKA